MCGNSQGNNCANNAHDDVADKSKAVALDKQARQPGQWLPLQLCRQHVRYTRDSCRLAAPRKVGGVGLTALSVLIAAEYRLDLA
jgi:hypothetical protein